MLSALAYLDTRSLCPESGSTTTTFHSAAARVVEATRDAGIADILARDPEHAAARLEHGFTYRHGEPPWRSAHDFCPHLAALGNRTDVSGELQSCSDEPVGIGKCACCDGPEVIDTDPTPCVPAAAGSPVACW